MVGANELDLVRIVEMTDRLEGTKVHDRLQVDDPKSVFPLQAALGYDLAQSMFAQKRNLVCEGVTDMFYLQAVNSAAAADKGPTFTGSPGIVPAGAASKVVYFSVIYQTQGLRVAALLDPDGEGDKAAAQDNLVALLQTKRILRVKDFLPGGGYKGAEIEDLFRDTLAEIAKELGWNSSATVAQQETRPIVRILRDEHGNKVSKWKLSKAFAQWLHGHGYLALSDREQAAWRTLVDAVDRAPR
jgi:hypothetical protein